MLNGKLCKRLLLSPICGFVIFCLVVIVFDNGNGNDSDSAAGKPGNRNGRAPDQHVNAFSKLVIFPQGGGESQGAPPWPTPAVVEQHDLDFLNDETRHFIVGNISFSPGQGNIMFQYAALYALSLHHNATLLLSSNTTLRRAYDLSAPTFLEPDLAQELLMEWNRTTLRRCCRHYPQVFELDIHRQTFFAYFQSYRFFHPKYERQVRQQFTFLPPIRQRSEKILNEAKQQALARRPECTAITYVGVHVRHGIDMTWNIRNIEHGHITAPSSYFKRAMQHFMQKYDGNCTTFLIASDDLRWCRARFKEFEFDNLYYIESGQREVDMGALTMTNHTIMSQGTFSWWIAYLTAGDVVYFGGWPRAGSTMEKMLVKDDYFLPHWVPMT